MSFYDPSLHYRHFHSVDPDRVEKFNGVWVPGGVVLVGPAIDVGYGIKDSRSAKDGWYVHDFGKGVKMYRRAKPNEKPTHIWRGTFPEEFMVLGWNLGFTYKLKGKDTKIERKGSPRSRLAVAEDKKILFVIDPTGVIFLFKGGRMNVSDWIRN
jgi:hypothetical protein